MDRTLKGLRPLKYFSDARYRLRWHRLPVEELPEHYKTYYLVGYEGQQRGELFWGKSGLCFAIVYDGPTLRCKSGRDAAMHMAGLIAGGPAS